MTGSFIPPNRRDTMSIPPSYASSIVTAKSEPMLHKAAPAHKSNRSTFSLPANYGSAVPQKPSKKDSDPHAYSKFASYVMVNGLPFPMKIKFPSKISKKGVERQHEEQRARPQSMVMTGNSQMSLPTGRPLSEPNAMHLFQQQQFPIPLNSSSSNTRILSTVIEAHEVPAPAKQEHTTATPVMDELRHSYISSGSSDFSNSVTHSIASSVSSATSADSQDMNGSGRRVFSYEGSEVSSDDGEVEGLGQSIRRTPKMYLKEDSETGFFEKQVLPMPKNHIRDDKSLLLRLAQAEQWSLEQREVNRNRPQPRNPRNAQQGAFVQEMIQKKVYERKVPKKAARHPRPHSAITLGKATRKTKYYVLDSDGTRRLSDERGSFVPTATFIPQLPPMKQFAAEEEKQAKKAVVEEETHVVSISPESETVNVVQTPEVKKAADVIEVSAPPIQSVKIPQTRQRIPETHSNTHVSVQQSTQIPSETVETSRIPQMSTRETTQHTTPHKIPQMSRQLQTSRIPQLKPASETTTTSGSFVVNSVQKVERPLNYGSRKTSQKYHIITPVQSGRPMSVIEKKVISIKKREISEETKRRLRTKALPTPPGESIEDDEDDDGDDLFSLYDMYLSLDDIYDYYLGMADEDEEPHKETEEELYWRTRQSAPPGYYSLPVV